MKKFVELAAAVIVLGHPGARHGADAFGPGLIDSLVQQYQQVEHASSVHAARAGPDRRLLPAITAAAALSSARGWLWAEGGWHLAWGSRPVA